MGTPGLLGHGQVGFHVPSLTREVSPGPLSFGASGSAVVSVDGPQERSITSGL